MSRPRWAYFADTRKTIKGRTEAWIRGYIARNVIHVLAADEEMNRLYGNQLLSPSARIILNTLAEFVSESPGREPVNRE